MPEHQNAEHQNAERPNPERPNPERPNPERPNPALGRLRAALRPQLTRAQVVLAVLLAIVGFLGILQIRSEEAASGEFANARREDLLQLLDSLDAAATRARGQIQDLEERRRELESSASSRRSAIEEARDQVRTLGLLAGTLPATGPGIVVRVKDPQHAVGTSTLLNAIEELRDAGAEAIEINDSVRVVAQSALVDEAGGVTVDGTLIRPPYVIEAIGDPHTLRQAMLFPGGLADEVERLDGSVSIRRTQDVDITSLYSHRAPRFTTPAGSRGG